MRLKAFFSLLLVVCLLASTASLMGRNTPYPKPHEDDPASHPWQDDNQWSDDNPNPNPIVFPIGPVVITLDLPSKWIRGLVANSNATPKPQSNYRTAKPMSLNQKGMEK